jgi:hypothetical protein
MTKEDIYLEFMSSAIKGLTALNKAWGADYSTLIAAAQTIAENSMIAYSNRFPDLHLLS